MFQSTIGWQVARRERPQTRQEDRKRRMEEEAPSVIQFRGPAIPLALLKRQRYGKDTSKFRLSSTAVYRLCIWTVSATQPAIGALAPALDVTTLAAAVSADILCDDPQIFTQMNARTTTFAAANPTLYARNNLFALGCQVYYAQQPATVQNPFFSSFVGFKIDGAGFNANETVPFNTLCGQFEQVKQGPTCLTIMFPDGPARNTGVHVERRPNLTTAQVATEGTAGGYVEHRNSGRWEYIIIPPRTTGSIAITAAMTNLAWDKMIDMGFKAFPFVGEKGIRLYVSPDGINLGDYGRWVDNDPAAADVYNDPVYTRYRPQLKHEKAGWCDTERVCQMCYNDVGAQISWIGSLSAQGYNVIPFGSGCVIRFNQYAPVSFVAGNAAITQSALQQRIPVELHVDTSCKFRNVTFGQVDLDQFTPNNVNP